MFSFFAAGLGLLSILFRKFPVKYSQLFLVFVWASFSITLCLSSNVDFVGLDFTLGSSIFKSFTASGSAGFIYFTLMASSLSVIFDRSLEVREILLFSISPFFMAKLDPVLLLVLLFIYEFTRKSPSSISLVTIVSALLLTTAQSLLEVNDTYFITEAMLVCHILHNLLRAQKDLQTNYMAPTLSTFLLHNGLLSYVDSGVIALALGSSYLVLIGVLTNQNKTKKAASAFVAFIALAFILRVEVHTSWLFFSSLAAIALNIFKLDPNSKTKEPLSFSDYVLPTLGVFSFGYLFSYFPASMGEFIYIVFFIIGFMHLKLIEGTIIRLVSMRSNIAKTASGSLFCLVCVDLINGWYTIL